MATSENVVEIDDIETRYKKRCEEVSDINEHLPILAALAKRCAHVTEFGVRFAASTTAFLMGQPKTLVSWDIDPLAVIQQEVLELVVCTKDTTKFEPRAGDSLKVDIEPTDLLFIDSLHTGKQLWQELTRHGMKARKFLVFHDTETFGEVGEDGDESRPGLIHVIRTWRRTQSYPLWRPVLRLTNNNGLVVLQREKDAEQNGVFTWAGGTKWVGPGGWR